MSNLRTPSSSFAAEISATTDTQPSHTCADALTLPCPRMLDARLMAARAWEAEIESYYLQARGLGLLPTSPAPAPSWTLDRYMIELGTVPERVRQMDLPEIPTGTSEAAVAELTQVVNAE